MNGRTHSIVGLAAASTAAVITWNSKSILGVDIQPWVLPILGVAGALSADIDMEGNPAQRNFKVPLWIIRHMPFLKKALKHRGIGTHSMLLPAAAFMLSRAVAASGEGWVITFLVSCIMGWNIGYVSHLVVDAYNGKGDSILFPLYFKRVHIMSITTDTWEELLFVGIVFMAAIANIILIAKGMTI